MTPDPTRPVLNRLLEALPPRDRAHLLERCDSVPLAPAQVLYEPGDVIFERGTVDTSRASHLFFLIEGTVKATTRLGVQHSSEASAKPS